MLLQDATHGPISSAATETAAHSLLMALQVTGQCVCPEGNVCCAPESVEAKRMKESKIRKLQSENKELSTMLMESEQMVSEAKRRRLM